MGPIVLFETSRVRFIEYSRYQDSTVCVQYIFLVSDNLSASTYYITNFIYFLAQCPTGTAGSNCTICPVNTFADKPGEAACTSCKDGEITEEAGTRSKSLCVPLSKFF